MNRIGPRIVPCGIPLITSGRPQVNVGRPQITMPRPQNTANHGLNTAKPRKSVLEDLQLPQIIPGRPQIIANHRISLQEQWRLSLSPDGAMSQSIFFFWGGGRKNNRIRTQLKHILNVIGLTLKYNST